jgi:WhiB family transcriptional regulator, redox-sensing transcriptional regulator
MKNILFENNRLVSKRDVTQALPFAEQTDREWMEFAACKGHTSIFYPERGGDSETALKAFCSECPVQIDCFEYAIKHGETDGVWGGFGIKKRRKLARAIDKGTLKLEDITKAGRGQ